MLFLVINKRVPVLLRPLTPFFFLATQSTAEGVAEVLQRKVSKKINYAALEDLFGEEPKERTIEQVSTTSIGPTSLAVATGEVVATEEEPLLRRR